MPNGNGTELTLKQERFVEEYVVDFVGSHAAIRAGYSPHSAKGIAHELLEKPHVAQAVAKRVQAMSLGARNEAEDVQQELRRIAYGDPRQLMSWGPDGVELKESDDLTDDAVAMVSEISHNTTEHGGTVRVKTHNKLDALEKLAKIHQMYSIPPDTSPHVEYEYREVTIRKFYGPPAGDVSDPEYTVEEEGEEKPLA